MQKNIKHKLLRRLAIIEGQLRGVRKMVEEERYCVDVITQTEAVKSALSGVESALLKNHLFTCAAEQMRSGQERKAVSEMLKVYQLAQRRK